MTTLRFVMSDGNRFVEDNATGTVVENRDLLATTLQAGASVTLNKADGTAVVLGGRHVVSVEVTP